MKQGRIAIFSPSLRGGGAERVVATLASQFAKRGLEVDLVLALAEGPQLDNVSPAVRIVDLKAGRVMKALLPLARYMRRERPIAMLSVQGHANVVAIVSRMLSHTDTRLVVSERNMVTVEGESKFSPREHAVFILTRFLYKKADGICTVSDGVSKNLSEVIRIPLSRVKTIYNPFDLNYIAKKAAEPLEHPWFAPGQPAVLLAVGRLSEQKDFISLIKAFSLLRAQRAVRLMILGEGEMRATLETMISEHGLGADDVQMPGFVANPFAYLARCALFVLSSRWEGLPGVLIEAMACGAPVVSTNCPSGPHEILEGGRWGQLVPVADVEALARAAAEVLDTPAEQLPDVRLRAREFDLEQAVDAYLHILTPAEESEP